MADNVAVTAGSGTNIAADELTDATLGSVKVQFIKLMDGTLDGSLGKAAVKAGGTLPNASTDGALVVTIRDINANGQTTMSASAPVVIASDQSVITVRYPILVSAGTSQFALAITTNTTLTVPGGTRLAQFSVETADVRYTDDGTSATTTVGQLAKAGSAWQYAGPLASMKFTAVSGSPTINVSYYK